MSDSCDPMDGSPPSSSLHGIFQARILEWVAIPYSRGSSRPRAQTQISCISCIGRLGLLFIYLAVLAQQAVSFVVFVVARRRCL